MNFKKFTSAAAAGAITGSIFLGAAVPAFAIYESVPADGARVTLVDSGNDLGDLWLDMDPRDDVETYDLGDYYVYGNGDRSEDGDNSYDDIVVEMPEDPMDLGAFALISVDVSNASDPEYNVLAYSGNKGNTAPTVDNEFYMYSTSEDVPSLNTNVLQNLYEDAIDANDVYTGGDDSVADQLSFDVLTTAVTSSSQVGDPDRLPDHFAEVYVYWEAADGDEFAFQFNPMLGSAMQDEETAEVPFVNVSARQTRGRIDYNYPTINDGTSGITAFEFDITGCNVAKTGDAGWATTNDYKDQTHFPTVFFRSSIDDSCDVNVATVNAEGDVSDGVDMDESDFEVFAIDDRLDDVDGTTFESYITQIYKLAYVDGQDGTYGPDDNVTRGQFAKFVMNTFNIPFYLYGDNFTDVPADYSLAVYIHALKTAGISTGYSDGTYEPDANITRAEASTLVVRAAQYFDKDVIDASGTSCFADVAGSVHAQNICGLADHNDNELSPIIGGYSNGDFGVDDPLTRGQFAKVNLNAGTSINQTVASDTAFINIDTNQVSPDDVYAGAFADAFLRVFLAPIEVQDFDAEENAALPDEEIDLTWEGMEVADDMSVAGYVIQYSDKGEDDWDDIKTNGTDIVDGVFVIQGAAAVVGDDPILTGDVWAYTVPNLSDDSDYDFRIAAFKWIPFDFSDEDYDDQADMQTNLDEQMNMVIGSWVEVSASTDES